MAIVLLLLATAIMPTHEQYVPFLNAAVTSSASSSGVTVSQITTGYPDITAAAAGTRTPTKFYQATIPAQGEIGIMGFVYAYYTGARVEAITLWMTSNTNNLNITFGSSLLSRSVKFYMQPITTYTAGASLSPTSWTKVFIPASAFAQGKWIDRLRISNNDTAVATVQFAGFAGNINGTDTVQTVPAQPLPSGLDTSALTFATFQQSEGVWGDSGLQCNFFGDNNKPFMGNDDIADVFLQPYRETNQGDLPMQLTNVNLTNNAWSFPWLYGFPDPSKTPTIVAKTVFDYPNPFSACVCHNADYYIIGDPSVATSQLVVWLPDQSRNLRSVMSDIREKFQPLSAYAQYVKSKRVNGKDTVSIHLRMRVPNRSPYNGTIDFKLHGYDVTYETLPMFDKLIYFSGEYYAVPFRLTLQHWHLLKGTITLLQNNGTKLPPPLGDWGSAWWTNWNMKEFNNMLINLYTKAGQKNIITFPAGSDTTSWIQNLFFSWGATLLNGEGRCGMDTYAETALNETFVNWVRNYPKLVAPRVTSASSTAWAQWKNATPIEPPWMEPKFPMAVYGIWDMWPEVLSGFALTQYANGYRDFFTPIYPPTGTLGLRASSVPLMMTFESAPGIGSVTAQLAGLSRTSRNATLAHEALIEVLARSTKGQIDVINFNDPFYDADSTFPAYSASFLLPSYTVGAEGIMWLTDTM
ncbi:hypothetical protein HDV00_008875 [Rhizophlyctis rosea]|nr:hypothetical protein HDV00_008875 [Rhizophlyctis rosea]